MDDKSLRLTDAIDESFDLYSQPKNGATFCNFSVFHVLQRMGADQFRDASGGPMLADQMIDAMTRSPAWEEIQMEQAQDMANSGEIVVAGMTGDELKDAHGHVVVVRPGIPEFSPKYGALAPKVSHCGHNPYIGRAVSWAFPGSTRPRFWKLKG